jgi:hypothetical protein
MALFRPNNPAAVGGAMTALLGAAAGWGGSSVTGVAFDGLLRWEQETQARYATIPHRVLVVPDADAVTLYVSNLRGQVGPGFARLDRGTFTASTRKYPGEVDLTIRPSHGKPISIRARRGIFHHAGTRTCRAVVSMARTSLYRLGAPISPDDN